MNYTQDEIKEFVIEKAKILDSINPNWPFKIDVPHLDMGEGACCIVGQLQLKGVDIPFGDMSAGCFIPQEYGIVGLTIDRDEFLKQLWVEQINDRSRTLRQSCQAPSNSEVQIYS